jgi:hypothetical protein
MLLKGMKKGVMAQRAKNVLCIIGDVLCLKRLGAGALIRFPFEVG